MENVNSEPLEKPELLRTIRADNIFDLKEHLPKANYMPVRVHKEKGIKSIIETLDGCEKEKGNQEKTIDRVESC